MRRGRNNDCGRGGGRRGNRYNNEESRDRDGDQNQGGGRGRNGPNRGSHHQPPAPPQAAAPQQSAWTGKRWGPSSSTAPLTPSPASAPSQPAAAGNRDRNCDQNQGGGRGRNDSNRGSHHQPPAPPQAAAPQQSAWTGKRWGSSSSTAPAPVNKPLTPSPVAAPSQPTVDDHQPPAPPQEAAPQQSAWTGKRWGPSSSTAPAPVNKPLTPSPAAAPSQPTADENRDRDGGQNQGSGRGRNYLNRGSDHQPPAPPQAAAPQQSAWTGKRRGPSSSTEPAPVDQPLTPSPAAVPSQPTADVEKPCSSSSPSKEVQIEAIKRPDHGKPTGRSVSILVNHFHFASNKQIIYQYEVNVVDDKSSNPLMGNLLKKSVKRIIRERALPDYVLHSVYDGENIIFSAVPLPSGNIQVDVPRGEEGVRSGTYTFSLGYEKKLEMADYFIKRLPAVPRHLLQGFDLVMKDNPRTCFFRDENKLDLGYGLLAYKNIRSSLKPTEQGLALCLDYSVLAFPKPLPVIDFLMQNLRGFRGVNDVMRMRREIITTLKGLKVKVTHRRTNQKYTIVGLTDQVTCDIHFELEDREGNAPPQRTRLVDYFKEKWGKVITHQRIPCLDVGKLNKPNVVPMEFCVVVERQRFPLEKLDPDASKNLKAMNLVRPHERSRTISDMVNAPYGPFGDLAMNFGIDLKMNMTKVKGRVIAAPDLKLGRGAPPVKVDAEKCQWNLIGKSFVEAKPLDRWALLDFTDGEGFKKLQADPFINGLRRRCNILGIQMAYPVKIYTQTMRALESIEHIKKLLVGIKKECSKLQMIVCAMSKKHNGYKYLKWVSETEIGVVTQCLLSTNANKGQDQYIANLCLKINAKLGGTNFEVSGRLLQLHPTDHWMFIGADVNHPPMNSESPSIAAVVGTVNWPAANRYAARVSPQAHHTEGIKNFGEMCSKLVLTYARINKVRPKRIVVFRDGVSEGQFQMVLSRELMDLKNSIYTNDYKPLITVIVAQKRHQTRLFPEHRHDGGPNGNVPPGTVVDTTIVHPHDFDFYLCSHYGGIGTSKPTHYYVLYDENGFKSDCLQKLIYELCFTFVRCTKPVSLVPPIYYADLVAYRGRMYQEAAMESRASTSPTPPLGLHSDLENMMFFV